MDPSPRMMQLFGGYMEAYGTYKSEQRNESKGGKLEIKASARTVREPVTLDLWRRHLVGEVPLGIIPIQIDGTCVWGVIDVDVYDIQLSELVERVRKLGLPLVTCRTKSGGAHLFMFLSAPTPAIDVVARLREMAAVLGHGTAEVFPKQTRFLAERGDLGNWLNMPYFGGDQTTRYGVKPGGLAMTTGEFLAVAEAAQITHHQLLEFRLGRERKTLNGMADGPPCLQHLTGEGFPEGSRNNGLLALGVLCKKKYGDNWEDKLEEFNRDYMVPPLATEEVRDVIRRLGKKDYNYRCKDSPLVQHCNSALCRTRRFGVGGDDEFPVISGMSMLDTEPPIWFLDIEGERLEMSTDDLQNYRRFHKICMERLVTCYTMVKQQTWLSIVGDAMRGAVRIEAPPEVGLTGMFVELLEDFCMNRRRGKTREDIVGGSPWEDEDQHRHYFRLRDLQNHIRREGQDKVMSRGWVTTRLRDLGGGADFFNIKGKGVNVWWVPASFTPIAEMDTPVKERDVM